MIARISPATRAVCIGLALFVFGVVINLRLIAKARHSASTSELWNAATIDATLAPLLAQLPPGCAVGWLPSSSTVPPRDAEPLYLLQYALAPHCVTADANAEWLITESPDHTLHLAHRSAK